MMSVWTISVSRPFIYVVQRELNSKDPGSNPGWSLVFLATKQSVLSLNSANLYIFQTSALQEIIQKGHVVISLQLRMKTLTLVQTSSM